MTVEYFFIRSLYKYWGNGGGRIFRKILPVKSARKKFDWGNICLEILCEKRQLVLSSDFIMPLSLSLHFDASHFSSRPSRSISRALEA